MSQFCFVNLKAVTCSECGITFGLPDGFYDERLRDHKAWRCPNGHDQVFGGKTVENLQADIKDLRKINQELIESERKAKAEIQKEKIKSKKLRYRIRNGVCPCCRRSFQNLRRHVETKHPDFGKKQ